MAHASSDGTTSASSNGQSARIAARDQAISVLSRHMTMDRFGFFLDLERSQGSHLVTLKGEHILDCYSAFASLPVGWNQRPSERLRIHLIASERIRAGPNRFEHVSKPAKTSKNLPTLQKCSENFRD